MRKFNLFDEIIKVNKTELLKAINSTKEYGINIKGSILYAPFDTKEILIYQGKYTPKPVNALMPTKVPTLAEIFGKNYQIVEDSGKVLIKAFSNWQKLIKINMPNASYDDTTGDGVDKFANEILEEIGWHATEFNINYRTLVDILEKECDGVLLCIEQDDPYQFSGLGFLNDDTESQNVLFSYCQNEIKKIMREDPLYAKENLNDDEREAAKFFKCL